jgi:glycosyltransferase involved in cell wall biosynthesis
MGRTNDVTVVIPCYNHANAIERSVMSALHNNYMAIVVDDCSTDNLSRVMERLPAQYVCHEVNQGVAAARNTGVREVKTPWFVPLDADDFLLPGALDAALKFADKADIVFGDYTSPEGNLIAPPAAKMGPPTLEDWRRQNLIWNTSLVRKSLWEEAGGYEEGDSHYEDWLFWTKCFTLGARFVYAGTSIYCYGGSGHRTTFQEVNASDHVERHQQLLNVWLERLPSLIANRG